MIKNLLKGAAVVLAVSEIIVLWFLLTLAEPNGRIPGGRLSGEEVTGRVTDWSFTRENRPLTLEVRPSNPYSVNTSFFVLEGNLYVSSILGGDSRWAQFLVQDPNMRIRVGDKLYRGRATKMEGAHLEQARQAYSDKYPNRTPEQIAERWFFRMDSR